MTSLPSDETLAEWWSSGNFGGLRPKLNTAERNPLRVACTGVVLDGEREVGAWRRDVALGEHDHLRVELRELRLDEEVQERGFGRPWYWHCEERYRAAGVDLVNIHAEDVGGYVWATCGFSFLPGGESGEELRQQGLAACDLLQQRRDALFELVEEGKLTEVTAERFIAHFPDAAALRARTPIGGGSADIGGLIVGRFTSPEAIADYGRADVWMEGNRAMWVGKAFLIGSTWQGTKRLNG